MPKNVVGSETIVDNEFGVRIFNETSIPDDVVVGELVKQHPELSVLTAWSNDVQRRAGGIFERDRFLTPKSIFQQFATALDAAETDDVVSGVLETTESLAFSNISIECDDEDEEDIWNQIIEDIDLYTRAREMWRELFTVSQFYAATYWVRKSYKVRGKTTSGNKKRKSFNNILVPGAVSILDPLKVVPVGSFLFNQEKLVYIADRGEAAGFDKVLAGENSSDLVVSQMLQGKYEPDREEKKYLKAVTDANVDNLYLLNPKSVWRHTATRPSYQRFATVRMKSVFELLDMKQQLRQSDRAHLIGNTNFIVLVKKGSDAMPAKQNEVQSLANQVKMASKVPVIVGDHRVEVEIVTPKMDFTLIPEKYNTLDARITARLFQILMTGNYSAGAKGDDSIKLARVVARGMEARRNMIGQSFFRNVLMQTMKSNDKTFTSTPQMHFHPKRIALDFDANVLNFYQELRDRGDLSRDTILSEMDIDQEQESRRRKREKELYDDVFKPPMAMLMPGAEGGPPAPPLPPATGTGGVGGNTGKKGGTGAAPGGKRAGQSGGRKGGTNGKSFTSTPKKGPNKALFEELAELDPVAMARIERAAKRALSLVPKVEEVEEEEIIPVEKAEIVEELETVVPTVEDEDEEDEGES